MSLTTKNITSALYAFRQLVTDLRTKRVVCRDPYEQFKDIIDQALEDIQEIDEHLFPESYAKNDIFSKAIELYFGKKMGFD